jgi:hypothetical protein
MDRRRVRMPKFADSLVDPKERSVLGVEICTDTLPRLATDNVVSQECEHATRLPHAQALVIHGHRARLGARRHALLENLNAQSLARKKERSRQSDRTSADDDDVSRHPLLSFGATNAICCATAPRQ